MTRLVLESFPQLMVENGFGKNVNTSSVLTKLFEI